MELSIFAVILGFFMDLLIGDPHWLYHPIRLVGHLISCLERLFRGIFLKSKAGELSAGVFLVVFTVGITTFAAWGLLFFAGILHPYARFGVETLMCYQILATKSLKDETMKVYQALKAGDLIKARHAVSMVVGRDTDVLDEVGVTKAAVETVAENTSDGVIAPLLFLIIGGAPLGFFYKATNTLDSMVGYKNEKYLYFGRAAAKFDDVLNYIPSRLSAVLMTVAAAFCGLDLCHAWKIYLRDRSNHSSPNSAHTEAVAAGALHIQLAGNAYYFGKLYEKPTIGDPDRAVEYQDIKRINQLMYATAILALLVFATVKGVMILWIR